MSTNKRPYPRRERDRRAKTRPFAMHQHNPAGTKALLRYFKAKNGVRAESVEKAREWYALYLADAYAKARKREAERKAKRTQFALRKAA
jgi:hypothetical protein